MKRLYFFFLFVFTTSAFSQNIDSLRFLLGNSSEKDTTYILTLSELAYQLYSTQPDNSLQMATRAEELARAIKYDKGLGRAIRVKGIYEWTKGNYAEATKLFQSALDFAGKGNDKKGVASCLLNLGVVCRNQGNYQKAVEYLFSSLKIREEIKDVQGIATCNNNLGLVYQSLHDYEKALGYFSIALSTQQKIKDVPGTGRSYLNIGLALQHLNRADEAITFYKSSLEVVEEIGDQRGITLALDNLANIYILSSQLKNAIPLLERGLAIAEKNNFKDRIADIKESFAFYYNRSSRPKEALKYATESRDIAREMGNVDALKNSLEQYSVASRQLGLYKEALESFMQYTHLKDSIWNDEIKRKALSGEYEFREDKIRIEQEKKELENRANEERQKRIINTIGGIAFTITVVAVFMFISGRKIRNQNKELDSQRKELASQNEEISSQRDLLTLQNNQLEKVHKVIEDQNAEIRLHNETLKEEVERRTRDLIDYNHQLEQFAFMAAHNLRAPVARILGLNNLLTSTSGKPEETKDILEKLVHSTRELDNVVKDISSVLQFRRDITSSLTPISIQEEFEAIKSILEEEIKLTGAVIVGDFSKTESMVTVKSYFQNIFLNLIGNAIKYRDPARPLVIKISTDIQPDYFVFSVSDNGLGINLNLYKDKLFELYSRFHFHVEGKGLGLYIVKTQVAIMGGKLEVESEQGVGSTFRVFLPTNSAQ